MIRKHAPHSPEKFPLVSVIICNYNYGHYITAAIESVMAQTWENIETIVIDDGSTDDSRRILEKYKERIRVILKENGGQASTFNIGISKAKGEIICFLDSDDFWYSDKVKSVVESYREGALGLICHDLQAVNKEGENIGNATHTTTHNYSLLNGYLLDVVIKKEFNWIFPPTSGISLPSKLAKKLLPFPEKEWRICADNLICYAAICHAPVKVINQTLGAYRYHGENRWVSHQSDFVLKRINKLMIKVKAYHFLKDYLEKIGQPAVDEGPKDTYLFYRQCCFVARKRPWRFLYSLWKNNIHYYNSIKFRSKNFTKFQSAKLILIDTFLSILILLRLPTPYSKMRTRYRIEAKSFNLRIRKYLESD